MSTRSINIPNHVIDHCAAQVSECLGVGAVRDPAVFAYAVDALALLPHAKALRPTTPAEADAKSVLVARAREIVLSQSEGEGLITVVAERPAAAVVAGRTGLADAAELLLILLPPGWVWLVVVLLDEEPVVTSVVPIRLPDEGSREAG
jgi:hypothetical protein